MQLATGASARVELTVTDADTAQALGSGDVPVLGTPRVLALAEAATVAATAGKLPMGATTVGTRVALDHLAPTPIGGRVTAEATLTGMTERELEFSVTVYMGQTLAARGTVRRVVVDRQRFLARASGAT